MSETVIAYVQEVLLAAPSADQDIYRLHQSVWQQVSRAQATRHRPTLLYRREGGLVRVRVTDSALKFSAPQRQHFCSGSTHKLQVRLVLDRTGEKSLSEGWASQRATELLADAGLDVLAIKAAPSRASGVKDGMKITLGIADVLAKVRVMQPELAASAWCRGIGRGKRFGFGMPMLSA